MSDIKVLVEELIRALKTSSPKIPLEIELWDTGRIALFLNISVSEVRDHVTHLPDFPIPIRFPSRTGRLGHPRWRAVEVIEWVHNQKHRR